MVTPLKKHSGAHGGLIALLVLVTTVVVVWTSHPKESPRPDPPRVVLPAAAAPQDDRSLPPPTPDKEKPRRDGATKATAAGTISYDEHRTHHVAVPVYGWLRKSPNAALGHRVRAGETLGVIYSPEIYMTTSEVIAQLRDYRSPEQLDLVRTKLLRWGMRREQLVKIQAMQKPDAALPLIARVSGTIVAEQGKRAQLVDPTAGVELFTISDPTYAVFYADIDADVAERARLGMTGRVTVDGIAHPYIAPIGYIARRVEDGKRTVRFDLHDPSVKFRAETRATVELKTAP